MALKMLVRALILGILNIALAGLLSTTRGGLAWNSGRDQGGFAIRQHFFDV